MIKFLGIDCFSLEFNSHSLNGHRNRQIGNCLFFPTLNFANNHSAYGSFIKYVGKNFEFFYPFPLLLIHNCISEKFPKRNSLNLDQPFPAHLPKKESIKCIFFSGTTLFCQWKYNFAYTGLL